MIELGPLEAVTCLHEISLSYPASENQFEFFIGDLNIAWKKADEDSHSWTNSIFNLPSVELINKSIVICVSILLYA